MLLNTVKNVLTDVSSKVLKYSACPCNASKSESSEIKSNIFICLSSLLNLLKSLRSVPIFLISFPASAIASPLSRFFVLSFKSINASGIPIAFSKNTFASS